VKVGFTGTRHGMTEEQWRTVRMTLIILRATECHHGDCIGADLQFAKLASVLGGTTVSHPPVKRELRAFHMSDQVRAPKTYVARDHDIVDDTDVLIATPKTAHEEPRSGTWLTVRYARKQGKRVFLILPDGRVGE
jgi:hypothetical protein